MQIITNMQFYARINKIMKIIEFHLRIIKKNGNPRISLDNYENYENHGIPFENHECYENLVIT